MGIGVKRRNKRISLDAFESDAGLGAREPGSLADVLVHQRHVEFGEELRRRSGADHRLDDVELALQTLLGRFGLPVQQEFHET